MEAGQMFFGKGEWRRRWYPIMRKIPAFIFFFQDSIRDFCTLEEQSNLTLSDLIVSLAFFAMMML